MCAVQIKSYVTQEHNALQTASSSLTTALGAAQRRNVCQEGLDLTAQ